MSSAVDLSHKISRSRGFTLVEVLIALAVVALGAAALMSALSSGSQTVERLRDRSFAEWVALNRLTELRLAAQWPAESGASGELEMAGRRWQWRQLIEPTEVERLWRLQIDVRPLDTGRDAEDWLVTIYGARGAMPARSAQDDAAWDRIAESAP